MKAIITKYFGPGNVRGSRIKAIAEGVPALYIPYPHELSGEDVHRKAAQALADKYQWKGELVGGALPDGTGYCFNFYVDNPLLPVLQQAQAALQKLREGKRDGGTMGACSAALDEIEKALR